MEQQARWKHDSNKGRGAAGGEKAVCLFSGGLVYKEVHTL